jgi:hypothetical protein
MKPSFFGARSLRRMQFGAPNIASNNRSFVTLPHDFDDDGDAPSRPPAQKSWLAS